MKRWLSCIGCLCVFAVCANAEILIYKGDMTEKKIGNGAESRHSYKSLLILDHATGLARKIDYYPGSGGFYMFAGERQFLTNRVVLKDGRSQTVLANAEPGSATEPVVSVFAKGSNARLQVSTDEQSIGPRLMSWSLRGVGPSEGDAETVDETGTFSLHQMFTMTVNTQGEGLDEAEQRIRSALEAQGYREVSFK